MCNTLSEEVSDLDKPIAGIDLQAQLKKPPPTPQELLDETQKYQNDLQEFYERSRKAKFRF